MIDPRRLLALLGLSALAPACAPGDPPNVLLVCVDTLRADALGVYGGPAPTPTFDRLAREGVLFEQAHAPAPATAPSHATLFTGQEPQRHGVLRNGETLGDAATTLAEAFRAQGWHTAGFVSSFVLDPRFGWGQGFEQFDAKLTDSGSTMGRGRAYPGAFWAAERFDGFDRRATATTDAAVRWIASAAEPFFAFVHYFDPHAPYVPPPVFGERLAGVAMPMAGRGVPGVAPEQLEKLIRQYHAEVLYTDDALAALVDAAAQRKRPTLVVVTSDHGEGLGQHDWLEHAVHLYEEQVRVPLIVTGIEGVAAGRRIATPVALADVAPTVLELAGLPPLPAPDGRSLANAVRRGDEPDARPIFGVRRLVSEKVDWDRGVKLSVRRDQWKYIWASERPHELYDLASDPDERHDVLAAHGDVAAELQGLLAGHIAAVPKLHDAKPLSESTRKALQALGYVE